jgi:clan AA aspartic protease (TIGR02281 family)
MANRQPFAGTVDGSRRGEFIREMRLLSPRRSNPFICAILVVGCLLALILCSRYRGVDYALWLPLAELGNSDAQQRLGTIFGKLEGETRYNTQAADQGYASAQGESVNAGKGDRLVIAVAKHQFKAPNGGTASRDISAADAAAVKGDLTLAEAHAQVVEWNKAPQIPPQMMLTRTTRAKCALCPENVSSIGPEYVSSIAKTPPDPRGDAHEQLLQIRHGETFEDVLRAHGADKDVVASILRAFGLKHGESPVAEGQKIILQFADAGEDGNPAPIARISAYSDEQLKATIAIDDRGAYVPVIFGRSAAVAKRVRSDAESSAQTLLQTAPFGELTVPSGFRGDDALPQTSTTGSVRKVSEIPLQKQGGTYLVSATINNVLSLQFIIDSGASDVSIPSDVFLTLIRTGTINKEDILGKEKYKLADGTAAALQTFRIQRLKVGDLEIENVIASVAKVKGDLLLGQSFLTRFKSWSIDNERGVLLLN